MKKIVIMLLLLFLGVFLAAGTTGAAMTAISSGTPNLTGSGPDDILNKLYGWSNLQRVDDFGAFPNDQIWFNPDTGIAEAQAKYAGLAHDFGYIPDTNGNGTFEEAVVPLFSLGENINTILSSGPSGSLTGGPVDFIWTIKTSRGEMWTSLPGKNSDSLDHMVTWLISGNEDKPNNPVGSYVIAWEDLPPKYTDSDFNDLVVEVTVAPVPIPAAILLLGSGLVGLAGIRKKFKR